MVRCATKLWRRAGSTSIRSRRTRSQTQQRCWQVGSRLRRICFSEGFLFRGVLAESTKSSTWRMQELSAPSTSTNRSRNRGTFSRIATKCPVFPAPNAISKSRSVPSKRSHHRQNEFCRCWRSLRKTMRIPMRRRSPTKKSPLCGYDVP